MGRGTGWLGSKGAGLIVFGFAVNLIGLIGGALWLAPAQRRVESVSRDIALAAVNARVLRAANSSFDTAEHMQGLVFSVPIGKDLPDDVRAAMGELLRRSIARGRDGFRAYLAEAAPTGAADFEANAKRYEALAAAERADFTLENFRAANAFEADFAFAMVKAQGEAAMRAITLATARRDARADAGRRRLTLTLVALAGSTVVLLATLRGGGGPAAPEPGPARTLGAALRRIERREGGGEVQTTGGS